MKQFQRNKFLFLIVKHEKTLGMINKLKLTFEDCITRRTKMLWHISEEDGIYHITPYQNGKAFLKSILEKSKKIYEHVGFLLESAFRIYLASTFSLAFMFN